MNYLETATNCKMVFNATSHASHSVLNGYIEVYFTEISHTLVEWFAWPNIIPAEEGTHGIVENQHHAFPRFGDKVVLPTDWSLYV